MKKNKDDVLRDSRFDKPLTKEAARSRYERSQVEDEPGEQQHSDSLVEAKIKMAMADGAFDDLPGKGRPIDLRDYYALPEHLRVGYQMLKNSGFLPEEVRLKKEMESIREEIQNCDSEEKKKQLMKKLADVSQQFHFYMEYNTKFKKSLF